MRRLTALVLGLAAVLVAAGVSSAAQSDTRQPSLVFESPSGNIRCLIGQGSGKASVRCVTLRPRLAAQVVDGQKARERPFGTVGPLTAGYELSYGQSEVYLGFLCNSRKVGVSCVDMSTRRGFRIAKEGVITFPRPKPAPRPAPAPSAPRPSTPVPTTPNPGSGCDSNYSGACVPVSSSDLDCADISGTVYVVGTDIHRFDGDGDGVGCE